MHTIKYFQSPILATKALSLMVAMLIFHSSLFAQILEDPAKAPRNYNPEAAKCFIPLGEATGGETYLSDPVHGVTETLIQIINTRVEDGTDIILLIDQTGSMEDDIAMVKKSLFRIIEALHQWEDVRLGVAVYGDKNVDGERWFVFLDLSQDFDPVSQFIEKIRVTGGGDFPESVYDGIMQTVTQASWRENAKHMVLTIGDAPSLEPPASGNSYSDVTDYCAQASIEVNLFPVLINAN